MGDNMSIGSQQSGKSGGDAFSGANAGASAGAGVDASGKGTGVGAGLLSSGFGAFFVLARAC
ncbi:MAG: hypothetical protein NTW87_09760 [Planctomycetota bacterium]|nr:hypothetical protein [Planctomycetota bacterium]